MLWLPGCLPDGYLSDSPKRRFHDSRDLVFFLMNTVSHFLSDDKAIKLWGDGGVQWSRGSLSVCVREKERMTFILSIIPGGRHNH